MAPAKLWKYHRAAGLWQWILAFESATIAAVFGTRLVPSASNHPGSRYDAACVVGSAGSFWLVGGSTNGGDGADLWRLNTTSWQWAWMAGPQTVDAAPDYSAAARTVDFAAEDGGGVVRTAWGSRRETSLFFSAVTNCLHIFGGMAPGSNYKNDMWRHCPKTGLIAWMDGSQLTNKAAAAESVYPASPDGIFHPSYLPNRQPSAVLRLRIRCSSRVGVHPQRCNVHLLHRPAIGQRCVGLRHCIGAVGAAQRRRNDPRTQRCGVRRIPRAIAHQRLVRSLLCRLGVWSGVWLHLHVWRGCFERYSWHERCGPLRSRVSPVGVVGRQCGWFSCG